MLKFCLKYTSVLFFAIIFFGLFLTFTNPLQSASCGNGSCQGSETCENCPQDCGACPTPTLVPTTPTPTETPILTPTSEPTPTPIITITPTINPIPTPITSGCGNGICEASQNENCSSCSADCGSCPSSTSNPTPTPTSSSSTQAPTLTEKPQVTCYNFQENPTDNENITFSGKATSKYSKIAKIEVSIDEGFNWSLATFTQPDFNFYLGNLQDGNYPMKARAYDTLGDIGECGPITLVVDKIPPIVGGNMVAIGSQIIYPRKDGTILSVAGVKTSFVISLSGGITEAFIKAGNEKFPLSPLSGTDLWEGVVELKSKGTVPLAVMAKDGTNNTEERKINSFSVQDYGAVYNRGTKEPIKGARTTLYLFDEISKLWVVWDSAPYGQNNPQVTDDLGQYSFFIPAGKYYLEVKKTGYQTALSEITEFKENTVLNSPLSLVPYSQLGLSLGYFIPKIFPLQITQVPAIPNQEIVNLGKEIPSFSFDQTDGTKFTKDSLKGEKYVLIFFSPWSALSIEAISEISQNSQNLPNRTKIVGVSVQESALATKAFLARGLYHFFAVADDTGKYSSDIGITTLPYYVFVNSNSIIKEIAVGVLGKNQLIEKINKLD